MLYAERVSYRLKEHTPALVTCPRCGQRRALSDRRARALAQSDTPSVCRTCRQRVPKVTDADRLWWLQRFTNTELADLARSAYGHGDPLAVASWRAHLAPARPRRRRRRSDAGTPPDADEAAVLTPVPLDNDPAASGAADRPDARAYVEAEVTRLRIGAINR